MIQYYSWFLFTLKSKYSFLFICLFSQSIYTHSQNVLFTWIIKNDPVDTFLKLNISTWLNSAKYLKAFSLFVQDQKNQNIEIDVNWLWIHFYFITVKDNIHSYQFFRELSIKRGFDLVKKLSIGMEYKTSILSLFYP